MSVQHEIIACMPEIVDDVYHSKIAMVLRDKLSNDGYQVRHLPFAEWKRRKNDIFLSGARKAIQAVDIVDSTLNFF